MAEKIGSIALAATWRPEYHEMMLKFASKIEDKGYKVAVSGHGWSDRRGHFRMIGDLMERSPAANIPSGFGAVRLSSPVNTRMSFIDGVKQPGDEDTTRSYQLAAAGCFSA